MAVNSVMFEKLSNLSPWAVLATIAFFLAAFIPVFWPKDERRWIVFVLAASAGIVAIWNSGAIEQIYARPQKPHVKTEIAPQPPLPPQPPPPEKTTRPPEPTRPPHASHSPASIDIEMDQALKIGDCNLARTFVNRHRTTRQAGYMQVWIEKNCRQTALKVPSAETADEQVQRIQNELRRLNCYRGPIDGLRSTELDRAINAFNSFVSMRQSLREPGAAIQYMSSIQTSVCP